MVQRASFGLHLLEGLRRRLQTDHDALRTSLRREHGSVKLEVVDRVAMDHRELHPCLPQGAVLARPRALLQHFRRAMKTHQIGWETCKEASALIHPRLLHQYIIDEEVQSCPRRGG